MASNMSSIDDLIRQGVNPFDRINTKPGTFWGDAQDGAATVENIHQTAISDITQRLERVSQDHKSRSILMVGDSGSGKSHLLTRLRQGLNDKAFFAYIGPWVDSQYIWRHVLRYTIDSLMQVPEGQTESQLMLWLKGLSAFTKRSLKQRVLNDSVGGLLQSDRRKFISHLKTNYRTANIHSPDIFFGVLHDLTDPDCYDLACEWLRGDDLGEDSMQLLRVRRSVESEDDAKNLLANISKIATDTLPIVLCFDNLDNIPKSEDGTQDFQALFNVNTIIHNDGLKNFLIIVSVITNTWRRNQDRINPADRARIDPPMVQLKKISLDQAEALWIGQLMSLQQETGAKFPTPIFPLTRQLLEDENPGGKTLPRNVLLLGRKNYQAYKLGLVDLPSIPVEPPIPAGLSPVVMPVSPVVMPVSPAVVSPAVVSPPPTTDQRNAEFQLRWQQERSQIQTELTKITVRSSPELIQMLLEALSALVMQRVKLKALAGKYASYSMQYVDPKDGKIGIVWTEDANMTSFVNVMKACEKAIDGAVAKLYLIRDGDLGTSKMAGNKIYHQLFVGTTNGHIKPGLDSVQDLATYHSLVNAAMASELVIAGQVILLKELEELVRQTRVLQHCRLLQELGVLAKPPVGKVEANPVKDYLLQLLTVQQFIGRKTLTDNIQLQFSHTKATEIETLIVQLCDENRIQILNPQEKPDRQLLCWVPN
jgi:hypothetical protein